MKFTTRQLVILAVFGTLWGAVEISLGALLKGLNIPLSGAFLAAIGLSIALIGRLFVPIPGATFFIGVIAMVLKLFSIHNIIIGPMIGILAEAVIAELALTMLGQPSRLSLVIAGGLGVLWTLAQPLITGPLLFGREIFVVWLDLIDRGSRLFGLDSGATLWIVLALIFLYLIIGGVAGWLAWSAGGLIHARLGVPALPPTRSSDV
jgi:hypothetical protein